MIYVVCAFATILGIGFLFRVLTITSKHLNKRSPTEVANIIERHIQGTEGPWDWDDFTSVPIADDRLDAIRIQCLDLDAVFSEEKVRQLKRIAERLRQEAD